MRLTLSMILLIWAVRGSSQVAITPVSIDISPGANISEVNLTNNGAADRMFETSVKIWAQSGNEESFAENDDVLILPKSFTIKPKGQQKLRVILQKPAQDKTRKFYRIFITEVLNPHTVLKNGLRFLLNLSIPVFSSGLNFVESVQPEWSITRDESQQLYYLSLVNKGNSHLIVQNLSHDGGKLAALQYVLPGNNYRWSLPSDLSTKKNVEISFNIANKDKKLSLALPKSKTVNKK